MRKLLASTFTSLVVFSAIASDLPIRPDPKLTPGAVLTTNSAVVCQPDYAKSIRHTSGKLKAFIYHEYGLDRPHGHFEIDHLISLELGGADVAENLWPQSYDTVPWNAHVKNKLEERLHKLVCSGRLPLEQAQREIAADWIAAYEKYLGKP